MHGETIKLYCVGFALNRIPFF